MTNEAQDDEDPKNNDVYTQTMESFLRVALAGFGGALVGLSLSRRGGVTPLVQQQSQRIAQRGRPYTNQDLPAQWAVSCLTFASIFESTRLLSPTSLVTDNPYMQTIGDYSLGGAMAGSILRGLPVQGTKGKAPMMAPRLGAGLFAGLVLGLVPGVMVAGISMLEQHLEALEAAEQAQPSEGEAHESIEQEDATTKG
jgi:hypothetical protein